MPEGQDLCRYDLRRIQQKAVDIILDQRHVVPSRHFGQRLAPRRRQCGGGRIVQGRHRVKAPDRRRTADGVERLGYEALVLDRDRCKAQMQHARQRTQAGIRPLLNAVPESNGANAPAGSAWSRSPTCRRCRG